MTEARDALAVALWSVGYERFQIVIRSDIKEPTVEQCAAADAILAALEAQGRTVARREDAEGGAALRHDIFEAVREVLREYTYQDFGVTEAKHACGLITDAVIAAAARKAREALG